MTNTHITAPLNFIELTQLLVPLGALNGPAELHGLLCGKLAGGAAIGETGWLLEAVEFLDFRSAPDERVRVALSTLFSSTREQLQSDFGLKLMLPDDDRPLNERAQALSQWCHGFLTGFGSVDNNGQRDINEDAEEMLRDLAAIVQVEAKYDGESASDEADYMEVTEYARMVVNSLYLEFASDPNPSPLERPSSLTIH